MSLGLPLARPVLLRTSPSLAAFRAPQQARHGAGSSWRGAQLALASLLPTPFLVKRDGNRRECHGSAPSRLFAAREVSPTQRLDRTANPSTRPRIVRCATELSSHAGGGSPAVLEALRETLRELKVDILLVPTDDPHLSEVPPECFARRRFLSGFTGSAGTAVVSARAELGARLWTDGRYFLQAEKELPDGWTLMRSGMPGTPKISEWIEQNLEEGQTVGLDPTVHPSSAVVELQEKLEKKGIQVQCLDHNPVDSLWPQRPPAPLDPVRLHPASLAGATVAEKLASIRKVMEKEGATALVVSALDDVSYLFNIRGSDVANTPVVMAYALVQDDLVSLFVESSKLSPEVKSALDSDGVVVRPYAEVQEAVASLASPTGNPQEATGRSSPPRIWIDSESTNYSLSHAAGDMPRVNKPSPVTAMKARKNPQELEGIRAAHRRDGAALAQFFSWLEQRMRASGGAPSGGAEEGGGSGDAIPTLATLSEVDIDAEVTARRAAQWGYLQNSFDTIAGYGANGAVIHYSAEKETAAAVGTSNLLLLDSGAQYVDGTTDITRTVHFGTPTEHQRECFTRVLKGHLALAMATFPPGTPGFVMDAYARAPLWDGGLDYRHGIGHGVGASLAVHEGPQGIGKRYENKTPLEAGMVVSNEPGYYADGEFGIRIENLFVIVEKDTPYKFGGKPYLGFEPLSLAPLQRDLIDLRRLTDLELAYVDAYHQRVREEVLPLLHGPKDGEARAWLLANTEALERSPEVAVQAAVMAKEAARAAVGRTGSAAASPTGPVASGAGE